LTRYADLTGMSRQPLTQTLVTADPRLRSRPGACHFADLTAGLLIETARRGGMLRECRKACLGIELSQRRQRLKKMRGVGIGGEWCNAMFDGPSAQCAQQIIERCDQPRERPQRMQLWFVVHHERLAYPREQLFHHGRRPV